MRNNRKLMERLEQKVQVDNNKNTLIDNKVLLFISWTTANISNELSISNKSVVQKNPKRIAYWVCHQC